PCKEGGEFFDFVDGKEFGGDTLPSPTRRGDGGEVKVREWVEAVVKSRIIENWKLHDEPEHLRTIRDRILRNEQKACRWLGLYQEILQHGELECDNSPENMELRLTGLVVEKEGKLKVYNRVYEAVFNQNWVAKALADLRPYAEALESWVTSNKDESWLLRGQALQDAQAWATGKSLSDLDYQYLAASQELDKHKMQTALEAEKQARQILEEARQKARRQTYIGAGILGLSLLGAVVVAVTTEQARQRAFSAIEAERLGNNAIERFKWNQIDSLLMAMEAGQSLKSLVNQKQSIVDYPAFSPILSIQDILAQIQEKNSWQAHSESVNSVAFSPDGKIIASGSTDKTIKLWDVTTGQVIKTLTGHNNGVFSIAFSPDSKTIASGGADKTIKLWDVTTGQVIKTFSGHEDTVYSIAFSPDGKTIASGSVDQTIKLWDVVAGKAIKTLTGHVDTVNSVIFGPDGNLIASASDDKTIKVWDVTTGKARTLTGYDTGVTSVAFSPDGNMIISGDDSTVKLWDVTTSKLIKTLTGHSDSITSVVFSPDGKTIASSSNDKKIKIWDVSSSNSKTLTKNVDFLTKVVFSPDGKTVASSSDDNVIKLWNVADGKAINTLIGHDNTVRSVVFSPDGKMIASGSDDKTIKLWDTTTNKVIKTLTGHDDVVLGVIFSPDGKTLASSSTDQTIKLWDITTAQAIKTFTGHYNTVFSVKFSPDGKTIASGSGDKTIKLWDVTTGQLLKTFGHSDPVYSITFSPDGKTITSASSDRTIKLWDVRDGKVIKTLTGHKDYLTSIAFNQDGKTLASGSADNTIKLWNVSNGREFRTLTGHSASVNSVAFNGDGKILVSGSSDNTIKLWRLNIDDVLSLGCNRLQPYLISNPETLEKLKVCQNQSLFLAAAPTLVAQGEKLAIEGNYEDAIAKFKKAQTWDSKLEINPKVKAAPAYVTQGRELAKQGDFSGTVAKFKQAQQLDAKIDLDPDTDGLQDHAQTVAKQLASKGFVYQGRELAYNGDVSGAVAKFKQAQQLDAKIDLEPDTDGLQDHAQTVAKQLRAEYLRLKAEEYLKQGDFTKAVATYTEIEKLQPTKDTLAHSWNSLCWEGGLNGYAKDVMFACEKAVSLIPDDADIIDSRGLVRALTGDTKGAIKDFEAYIKLTDNPQAKAKRQSWVKDLKAGKNPFTPEELQKLQGE
ncbi:MAG: hypothetical protein C4322_08850, partial [Mastigocladus sp. ERB_26_1]